MRACLPTRKPRVKCAPVADHISRATLGWQALPGATQVYVAAVILAGGYVLATSFPFHYPRPAMFAILLISSCITSTWKVNLPGSLSSGSTLSVSYAADLTALLLLGPEQAMIVAISGALTQCTFNVKHYGVVSGLSLEQPYRR